MAGAGLDPARGGEFPTRHSDDSCCVEEAAVIPSTFQSNIFLNSPHESLSARGAAFAQCLSECLAVDATGRTGGVEGG